VPNAAHKALARLEQKYDGEVTVVTQNIDPLHEQAGSKRVLTCTDATARSAA
jgi:NAD-dependent deacetylase